MAVPQVSHLTEVKVWLSAWDKLQRLTSQGANTALHGTRQTTCAWENWNHCTGEHKEQLIFPSPTNGYELHHAERSACLPYLINSSKSPVKFSGGYSMASLMNLLGPGKTAEILCLKCIRGSWNPEKLSWILCKSIWDSTNESSISFMDIGLTLHNLWI